MPANPGAKKNNEKQKRKREVARKARQESLARSRAHAREQQEQQEQAAEADTRTPEEIDGPYASARVADFDDLDRLAGEVSDLIAKKQIDQAARVCAQIVRRFPNEPDGWQGFARVAEARGDLTRAVAEMERAAERVSREDDVTAAQIEKQLVRLRAAAARAK